jgi:hypothetical protein
MIFGDSLEQSLLLRSMMMPPMSTNHPKTIKRKGAISKFRLKRKECIHFKLIRLLNDLLKIDFKIIINIPRQQWNWVLPITVISKK